jgi:hypothetical protein
VVKSNKLNIKNNMKEKYNKHIVTKYTATGKPYYAVINENYIDFIYNQYRTGQINDETHINLKNDYYVSN